LKFRSVYARPHTANKTFVTYLLTYPRITGVLSKNMVGTSLSWTFTSDTSYNN
jgi:hypothetical protein